MSPGRSRSPVMATYTNILKVPQDAAQHFLNVFIHPSPTLIPDRSQNILDRFGSQQTNENTGNAGTRAAVNVQ